MNPTPRLKTTRVFIENQPEQCMIYAGRSSFGASPYAYTDSEEKATHIVQVVNSYDELKEALMEVLADYDKYQTVCAYSINIVRKVLTDNFTNQ